MKRRKFIILTSLSSVLSIELNSCSTQKVQPVVLTVSAAGVYRNCLAEIDLRYKKEKPNVIITYNIAGSGFLRQQIEQGASVDIYIPGIAKEMDILETQGLIVPNTRQNLTINSIVIITHKDSKLPISSFKNLIDKDVKRVAVGAGTVSAGIYTKEGLNFFGIYEQVRQKSVVAEEDIRQVLKQVESHSVDVGITYETESKISNLVKTVAVAPQNSHQPVISPLAILKSCQNISAAKDFIKFLISTQVKPLFEKYGFTNI
ncbi:molybdate ABC transporter substrate-binding protein [Iningainema tapete]|uniref:Molybdate ABC transporter substrate-binding protein n=1 Tax=Iningainema tapete BLCC-T55 TaxID=2748662 RepID=A0A8J6XMS9_9CYAN|nr:molybdate ABC transporter substrate-binding protein [Iningainema tapete]MBD2774709.1 molybdate ABC transporter substrate-binding protein [Iningainema tapete BLCC-T55]